jgi:hypothetical protein
MERKHMKALAIGFALGSSMILVAGAAVAQGARPDNPTGWPLIIAEFAQTIPNIIGTNARGYATETEFGIADEVYNAREANGGTPNPPGRP